MASNYNPDVAAILETLRQLGPPNLHGHINHHSIAPTTTHQPRKSVLQDPQPPESTPKVDPTTIISWPPALRYVLKTVASNEQILTSIRQLINTQHTHEREWHAARSALLQRHSQRPANRAKLSSILSAVNPALQSSSAASNATSDKEKMELEKDKEELETFDKKIYKAQVEMVGAMSSELERMGVPFFGLRKEFLAEKNIETDEERDHGKAAEKSKEMGAIDERELLALQKRMIEVLEDLVG